jgi:hypothetical protein
MLPFHRRLFARILLLLLVFLLAWQATTPVLADVAPPDQPSGVNPEPGEEVTQVRMLAETVILEVLADYTPESLGQARVSADFIMRNLGAAPETMPVRFPISSPVARSDGSYPEIHDLHISVNGQAITHRRITRKDTYYGIYDTPWAEFDVSFPPGVDVNILVIYLLDAEGWGLMQRDLFICPIHGCGLERYHRQCRDRAALSVRSQLSQYHHRTLFNWTS